MKFPNSQQKQLNGQQKVLKDLLFTSENFKKIKFIFIFKNNDLPLFMAQLSFFFAIQKKNESYFYFYDKD